MFAQEAAPKPEAGFGVALTGAGGIFVYTKDRRGVLHVNIVNRQDRPLELFSSTFFDEAPTLQFGRKIWVPARSRMVTWHPIKLPSQPGPDGKTVRFQSLFMQAADGKEVLIRTDAGQLKHDGFLQLVQESVTGVIESTDGARSEPMQHATELIAASRMKQKWSRRVTNVAEIDPGDDCLAPLDQLVIADDRPLKEAASMTAIRSWLFGGGHLWVMLDQVDPALLQTLLGDQVHCEVVDRVSLTDVKVEAGPAGSRQTNSMAQFEQPVDFLRVMVENVDVAYTVNGFPAAFWVKCGDGLLLVTTLSARGWMTLRPPGEPAIALAGTVGENPTRHIPTEPMSQMCSQFFIQREPPKFAPQEVEPIVQEYVGYSVPSRSVIVGLLAFFSLGLAGVGLWLWKIARLELMGIAGPVIALVVSAILIGVGQSQRQSVPVTAASVQLVEAIEGTDDYRARGHVGIYTPDSGIAQLGVTEGGWLMPEMGGLESTTRRMVWDDIDQWSWQNLPATSGLRNATFEKSGSLEPRISAIATFGPEGLRGTLTLPSGKQPADGMVATIGGRIGVAFSGDQSFTAPTRQVFSAEQFLSADLLSDEQNRRLKTLKNLFSSTGEGAFPSSPTLLFWTEPWELGFQFPEGARRLGATLVTVPVEFQRPENETDVSIASPLLLFRPVVGPDGTVPSGIWDPRKREWAEKSWPSASWFRYQIPQVLLPVKVSQARIVAKVLGPMGKLEVSAVKGNQVVPIKTWMDPVGTLEHIIDDPALLQVAADGGFLLRVAGGDPARPELTKTETSDGEKTNYWRIESFDLELKARTVDPSSPEATPAPVASR